MDCRGFRKEQPKRAGILGKKERESSTLGKSIVTNRDDVAVGRVIVDLLPMSPVGGSGRISIEMPLSIDEHCTTNTPCWTGNADKLAEWTAKCSTIVGNRDFRSSCVRIPCPIYRAVSDYRVRLLEVRCRNLLCVDLIVPMSAHRYAMDFGCLLYSDLVVFKA